MARIPDTVALLHGVSTERGALRDALGSCAGGHRSPPRALAQLLYCTQLLWQQGELRAAARDRAGQQPPCNLGLTAGDSLERCDRGGGTVDQAAFHAGSQALLNSSSMPYSLQTAGGGVHVQGKLVGHTGHTGAAAANHNSCQPDAGGDGEGEQSGWEDVGLHEEDEEAEAGVDMDSSS